MHRFSAGEGALLNPKSNATMDKSKLNWVYYIGEMFDVYVTPNLIKRLHAPLEPDLEYVTQMQCRCLHPYLPTKNCTSPSTTGKRASTPARMLRTLK